MFAENESVIDGMGLRLVFNPKNNSIGVYEVFFGVSGEPIAWSSNPVVIEFEDYDEYMESCTNELRDYVEAVENAFTCEQYIIRVDENGDEYLEVN